MVGLDSLDSQAEPVVVSPTRTIFSTPFSPAWAVEWAAAETRSAGWEAVVDPVCDQAGVEWVVCLEWAEWGVCQVWAEECPVDSVKNHLDRRRRLRERLSSRSR